MKIFTMKTIHQYIISAKPSKILDEWEQSTVEAEHVISRLTVENQTVLDCMMGSGTTGIAALNLNRRFIGIEVNPERFAKAQANIGNAKSNNSSFQPSNTSTLSSVSKGN